MLTDCNSLVTVCASKTGPKPSPLDPMHPVMERSHPTSGRPATPADINRNGRPTSIGTSGRHQSECPADIIGMRTLDAAHALCAQLSSLKECVAINLDCLLPQARPRLRFHRLQLRRRLSPRPPQ